MRVKGPLWKTHRALQRAMELYQLRTFKTVAEEGNLTRGAKKLNASQPAVSAHIRSLEDELGVSLFVRTSKGMQLTADGRRIKVFADKVLTTVDDMVHEATHMRGTLSGDLRIGINTEPDHIRISELFSLVKVQHPKLQIHLKQCMSGELREKLENGVLDAGFRFGVDDAENICTTELEQLWLVVTGPKGWQGRLSTATPEEIGNFPWIMTPDDCPFHSPALKLFKKYNLFPSQVAYVDQESIIKNMIKAEVGISLLLENDILREKKKGDLAVWEKEKFPLTLAISCLKRRREEPMLEVFFALLSRIWDRYSVCQDHAAVKKQVPSNEIPGKL